MIDLRDTRNNHYLTRAGMLRGVSTLAMLAAGLSAATPAAAQQATPGSAPCPIANGVVTCSGDVRNGFRSDNNPAVNQVIFQNLTQPIAPPSFSPVIDIRTSNTLALSFDNSVTINADAPRSSIGYPADLPLSGPTLNPYAAVAVLFGAGNSATATVTNAGTINADLRLSTNGPAEGTVQGGAIFVKNPLNASITHSGSISVIANTTFGNQNGYGIYADVGDSATVLNSGTIVFTGSEGAAVQLLGRSLQFTNRGTITTRLPANRSNANPLAMVARAEATQPASITFINEGNIVVADSEFADDIYLVQLGNGATTVRNTGTISDAVITVDAMGQAAGDDITVTVDNDGAITRGGIDIHVGTTINQATYGDLSSRSPDIRAINTETNPNVFPRLVGVEPDVVRISVTNSALLTGSGIDVSATGRDIDIEVINSGNFVDPASGFNASQGVDADGTAPLNGASSVRIINDGAVSTSGGFQLDMISASSSHHVSIINRGNLSATNIDDFVAGLRLSQGGSPEGGGALGVFDASATIENSGTMTLSGAGEGIIGIFTEGVVSDLTVTNSGTINVTSSALESGFSLIGVNLDGYSDVTLINSGAINAVATQTNGAASAAILFVDRSLSDAYAQAQQSAGRLRGYNHAEDLANRVTIGATANVTANGDNGFGIFGFLGLSYDGAPVSFQSSIRGHVIGNPAATASIDVAAGVTIAGGTALGSGIGVQGIGSVTFDNRGTILGRGAAGSGAVVLGDLQTSTILGGAVPVRPTDQFLNLVNAVNAGTIRSDNGYGIWAQNGAITNLVNRGLILGGQGSLRAARASSVVNQASGILDGRIALEGAGSTLTNDGIIRTPSGPAVTHVVNGDFAQSATGLLALRGGDRFDVTGNFVLNGDLNLALGAPSLNPIFTVGGNLTLDGRLNVTDAGGFGEGVYRLFNYGGGLTDNGLILAALPGGASGTVQTAIANQVNLVVGGADPGPGPTPNIQFWDGTDTVADNAIDGGTATWNNVTTNWTRAAGEVNEAWGSNFAVFQAAPGTVTIESAGVSASGLQFAVSGYTVTGGPLTLNAPSTLRVGDGSAAGAGYTATIASTIAGSGGIDKTDLGTLILSGVNTYSGGTRISSGVLQVSADTALGAAAGGVILNGGTLRAAGAFTSARGFNIGTSGGTIDTGGNALTLSGAIGGTGALTKAGTGTLVLSGASPTYGGMMTLAGGALNLAGTLGGTLQVNAGTRLSGTGTLNNLVLAGTLAPGNSIGTLSATGNVVIRAGATVEVEVAAAGGTDLLAAAGSATIEGGNVQVVALDPETQYVNGRSYTFLTAAGGRTGTFAGLSESSAFLDFALGYTANSAFLTVSVVRTFPDVALTFNQRQASIALMEFDVGGADALAVYNQLLLAEAELARAAFDAASGEIYPVLVASTLRQSDGRVSRLLGRAQALGSEGWGLWGSANGQDGRVDGDGNGARFTHDGLGGELGVDYRGPGNGWAIGFGGGYNEGGVRLRDRGSRAEADGWHVGGYARYGTGGTGFSATLAGAYASNEADVVRNITVGTLSRVATARVDVEGWSLGAELRYGLPIGGGWAMGPQLRIAHARAQLGGFAETGADSLNLTGGSNNDDSRTRYGGGLFARWDGANGSIDAGAAYVRGGADPTEIGLVMAGASSTPYRVRAARGDGDTLQLNLAGQLNIGGGWSLGANLAGAYGSRERSLQGSATVGWRF